MWQVSQLHHVSRIKKINFRDKCTMLTLAQLCNRPHRIDISKHSPKKTEKKQTNHTTFI